MVSFDVSVRVLCGLCCGFGEWLEVVVDLFANLPSSIYSLGREYLYLLLGLSLATNIIWLVIKLLSGRFLQRVIDYVLSIGLAYAIVELYSHYPGIVLSLTLIHGLIIDIVGWIVDKAVLLNAVRGV